MIRHRQKKSIAWLLIAGILHLVLITIPSGMAVASPSSDGQSMHAQIADSDTAPCHKEMQPASTQPECNSCADNSCGGDCSFCVNAEVSAGFLNYALPNAPRHTVYRNNILSRLTSLDQTIIPPPPKSLQD